MRIHSPLLRSKCYHIRLYGVEHVSNGIVGRVQLQRNGESIINYNYSQLFYLEHMVTLFARHLLADRQL